MSNIKPVAETYWGDDGYEHKERRSRHRNNDDPRIDHLFNGFDNMIRNADGYDLGYLKAMRQEFGELMLAAAPKPDTEAALQKIADFGQLQEALEERDALQRECDHAVEQAAKNADEVLALREERDTLRQYLDAAQRRGEELRAQVAALEVDAGRYKYLRDISRRDCLLLEGPEAGVWCDCEDEHGELVLLTEGDLDAVIDAARAAQGEKNG